MFFKAKPTIDEDDIEWQIECWKWLIANISGIEIMESRKTLIPSKSDFPKSGKKGHEHAEFVFEQVLKYFNVDIGLPFKLVEQEPSINPVLGPLAVVKDAPTSPLGTYTSSSEMNEHLISYAPDNLKNLENLIATFAHEICHPILLSIPTPPPGEPEAEEFATDLAMVMFGFGIFGGNSSFKFSQYTDAATGTQGWSTSRAGYLSQNEWGFAIALRARLINENILELEPYCSDGLFLHIKKNYKYLEKNQKLVDELIGYNTNQDAMPKGKYPRGEEWL